MEAGYVFSALFFTPLLSFSFRRDNNQVCERTISCWRLSLPGIYVWGTRFSILSCTKGVWYIYDWDTGSLMILLLEGLNWLLPYASLLLDDIKRVLSQPSFSFTASDEAVAS